MNWKLIESELPDFEVLVLLLEEAKEPNKLYCHLGSLQSIDKNGPVFKLQSSDSVENIVTSMFGTHLPSSNRTFKYWSIVDISDLPKHD